MKISAITKQWNDYHKILLDSKDPLAITKIGSSEAFCIAKYLQNQDFNQERQALWFASGVYAPSKESLEEWCEYYIKGIKASDYIHLWQEYCYVSTNQNELLEHAKNGLTDSFIVNKLKLNLKHHPVSYPHDHWIPFSLGEESWHFALSDKKILVVSSAKYTFEHQAKVYNKLWPGASLGGFEFVQVPQSELLTGLNTDDPLCWKDKLNLVKKDILSKDFDFAMVGCGGIGLMVIDFIKNTMNKSCTYLGGNLQLFFGIRGNRWENTSEDYYNKNEYWIAPLPEDTPENCMQLDNGPYWIK